MFIPQQSYEQRTGSGQEGLALPFLGDSEAGIVEINTTDNDWPGAFGEHWHTPAKVLRSPGPSNLWATQGVFTHFLGKKI